jgi:uncharacterized protein (TIGR03437 family)
MKKLIGLFALLSVALLGQTAETIPFRAVMLPSNEVPAVTIAASGAATVLVHVIRDSSGNIVSGSVDFNVSYQFPGAVTVTGLHIHTGAAGANGGVTINTGISSASPVAVDATGKGVIDRQAQVATDATTALATIRGMLDDPAGYYVNMHTTDNPGGVIRGQLQRAEVRVVGGLMSPANEVPAVTTTTASAIGTVIAYITRDTIGNLTSAQIAFQVDYTGMTEGQSFTGMHIHYGAAGVNGGVTLDSGISSATSVPVATGGSGTLYAKAEMNIFRLNADKSLYALLNDPSGVYLNVHTNVNPGGVMRTQLHDLEHIQFPVTMLPDNEVPAVTAAGALGQGNFNVYLLRDQTGAAVAGLGLFNVNYRFSGDTTITGFHIHEAEAGTNGPVRIDSGVSSSNPVVDTGGSGNITRAVTITSSPALQALNGLIANPEFFYINLHTTTNPGGFVRGQLATANTNKPAIWGIISAVSDGTLKTVAQGGLMTIFGTDISKVTTDLSGVTGTQMPTSANGSSVTVGGTAAPLIALGYVPGFHPPAYAVVQVPFETAAGSQPVIVTNPNGASTAATVTVAAVAPGIFYDSEAGIAFNMSNFSLVRNSNPAKAGDQIALLTTGLGQTTPALATGQIPSAGTENLAAAVTVMIGTQAATVQSAYAVPGFTGMYFVVVTVPTGATGSLPVVITSGTAASNKVMIPVN